MPKKQMTPEERKAWGEKMKAARLAKQKERERTPAEAEAKQVETEQTAVKQVEDVDDTSHANAEIEELKRQIEELKQNDFFSQMSKLMTPSSAVRAITKYSINPRDYPDPRERLTKEPRLVTEAFEHNFSMEWTVGKVNYEAKDGVNYTEPKFGLELWRWIRDPETNEITNRKFLVKKVTMFEDPDAAITAALDAGEAVPEQMEKAFLDEMRYLRIRDWIFDIFWPKPATPKEGIREEVIGNKLVRVMETSSTQPIEVPFGKL